MGFLRYLLFLLLVFLLARFIGSLIRQVARVLRGPQSRGPSVHGPAREPAAQKPSDVRDAKFTELPPEEPADQDASGNRS